MKRYVSLFLRGWLAAVATLAVAVSLAVVALPAAMAVQLLLGLVGVDAPLGVVWILVSGVCWIALVLLYGGDDPGGRDRGHPSVRIPRGPVPGSALAAAGRTADDIGAHSVGAQARTHEASMGDLLDDVATCPVGATRIVGGLVDGVPTMILVCRDESDVEQRAEAAHRGAWCVSPVLPTLPN